jgi:hypothetical protein
MANLLTGAVDFAPGIGDAVAVADTVQAARGGNYGTAAMLGGATMLGMLPVVGDAASKAVRGALRDAPDASDSGLVTRQLGGTKVEIRDPANPGLRLTLASDPEEGPFMSPYLEILGDEEQIGGRGTATKLYLEGLAKAQAGGLGWQSDSILSDSSYKMYDRLKNLGVPFSEATVGPKYSISAADLANVDIKRMQSNFLGRQSPSPLEGTLDMSQAARMQRAAEQGFNVDMPVYHGTDQGFEEFVPKTGLSGRASYFTDNPDVASAYAMGDVRYKQRGPEGSQVIPAFVRGNLLNRETLTRQAEADIWKQIEKADLKAAKPGTLKYEMLTDPKAQNVSDQLLAMSDADYIASNNAYDSFPQLMEALAETKKSEKILKGLGYDGVRGTEVLYSPKNMPGDVKYNSTAIFDPINIRSVNAAFDPAKRGSANLMAGAAGATIGLSALRNIQRDEEPQPD